MLIESLIALSLFGLLLTAVAEVHRTVATLTTSASERENRESQLLLEHYKEPSPSSTCTTSVVIPSIVNSVCCELELSIGNSQKKGRVCRLSPDAGSGLLSLILASFFLMLLATLSYPTIRQLLVEKKQSKEAHSQKLSVAETEAELQRVLFDNQALRIQGVSKILSSQDPIVNPAHELSNPKFTPHADSSILSTSEISLKYIISRAQKCLVFQDKIQFNSCASLPKDTELVAGFYRDRWEFLKIISQSKTNIPDCAIGFSYQIKKLVGEFNLDSDLALLALAPIRQSELYYLDNSNSLRRYSLVQRKTTPVDYGYSKFLVEPFENSFRFQIAKKDNEKERDFSFSIELESTNESTLLSLLY